MKKKLSNHIHEDFDIKDDILDDRIKLLRQERYFSESESCYLSIKGENYQVINYSSFGVAIICDPTKDFDSSGHSYDHGSCGEVGTRINV